MFGAAMRGVAGSLRGVDVGSYAQLQYESLVHVAIDSAHVSLSVEGQGEVRQLRSQTLERGLQIVLRSQM